MLLLSLLFFYAGIRIRFFLGTDLLIELKPSDRTYTISNNETQEVTFAFSIDTDVLCAAECSYALLDRSQDVMVGNGTVLLQDGRSHSASYVLEPYRKGSGQKIYNFDVVCKNVPSVVCRSTPRQKSSFITLNYQLTPAEAALKAELAKNLTNQFMLINNMSADLQSINILDNRSAVSFREEYTNMSQSLHELLVMAENIAGLWSQESYYSIQQYQKSFLVVPLADRVNLFYVVVTQSIAKQNELAFQFNLIRDKFIGAVASGEPWITGGNVSRLFNQSIAIFKGIDENVTLQGYESLISLEADLQALNQSIHSFNTTLYSEQKATLLYGMNLTLLENNKKCMVTTCTIIPDEACASLKRILQEFNATTYPVQVNFTSNESYYIVENGTARILPSLESEAFVKTFCTPKEITLEIPYLQQASINRSFEPVIQNELTSNEPLCCVYGQCAACCTDCQENESLYPVVLIHGHSLIRETSPEPILEGFSKIQYQMQEDGYLNAGTILFDFNESNYKKGDWGLAHNPVVVKASYYYDYFYSVGGYIYITRSKDNIDTYAIRLNDIVKLLQYRTGKPKVNIIAHSMGGLVARRYIQIFGEDSVNKVILISVPNKGIDDSVFNYCNLLGEARECQDLYNRSIFMRKLNSPLYEPKEVKYYTISGKGCDTAGKDGDGVVIFENSLLPYAEAYTINGSCTDFFKKNMHTDLLNIDIYPEVYAQIQKILSQ